MAPFAPLLGTPAPKLHRRQLREESRGLSVRGWIPWTRVELGPRLRNRENQRSQSGNEAVAVARRLRVERFNARHEEEKKKRKETAGTKPSRTVNESSASSPDRMQLRATAFLIAVIRLLAAGASQRYKKIG